MTEYQGEQAIEPEKRETICAECKVPGRLGHLSSCSQAERLVPRSAGEVDCFVKTETLLDERHQTHGSFRLNARYGQQFRQLFRESPGWKVASERQREALDYFAGKLSRILSGQPGHEGHWEDIAGYAHLACHPDLQR